MRRPLTPRRPARGTTPGAAGDIAKIALAALFIVLCAVGVVLGVRIHGQHVRACKSHGGSVSSTTTHYYDHQGHLHTDTTYRCVTPDGRGIIDVWG